MAILVDEVRATREAMRYGFAVGKVRVLETRSLDRAALERLLDAKEFAEQKRLLAETPYARYLEDAQTPAQVERALDEALDGFYGFLEQAALPESVVRFFRLRYDYANLKAALKARALSVPLEGLLLDHGTIDPERFVDATAELPGRLGALAARLADVADASAIDAVVDTAYFAHLVQAARDARSPYLAGIAAIQVDSANVRTLVRGRLAGLDAHAIVPLLIVGGSVGVESLAPLAALPVEQSTREMVRMPALRAMRAEQIADPSTLDPAMDTLVTAALRRGRKAAEGPEPVIAYVMGREAEVRTLRVLLLGRLTGIDNEVLRARVSASYR